MDRLYPVDTFASPFKTSSLRYENDKEFLTPEMNENFSFTSLGADVSNVSIRKETLTPGPVYYPADSHNRRTPGIDRPNLIRPLGAFEHSTNIERFLQISSIIGESLYSEFESYGDEDIQQQQPQQQQSSSHVTIPPVILGDSFGIIEEMSHRHEYLSPSSQPFFPQNQYSVGPPPQSNENTSTSFEISRSELMERVPPLPRGSQFASRLDKEFHPSYPLQSLVEHRPLAATDPLYRVRAFPGRSNNHQHHQHSQQSQQPQPQQPQQQQYPHHHHHYQNHNYNHNHNPNQIFDSTKQVHPTNPNQRNRNRLHGPYYGNYLNELQAKDKNGDTYSQQNIKNDYINPVESHLPHNSVGNVGSVGNNSVVNRVEAHSSTRSSSPKARSELVESPVSKLMYKEFLKAFKTKEGESFSDAISFAVKELPDISEKVRWRAYIDIADTLKRNSHYGDARSYYRKVCEEYPHINQGWLEWSKMEEECGNLEQSLLILRKGARANSYNEVLLTKAIKQHERLNNLTGAREMLGKLQEEAIDTTWRTVLEGSLLESRAGNIEMARKLLTALMTRVSWYGPIYHEAFRLEEKAEYFDRALAVVQKGLHELPRYGPLWFGLLRIMERKDIVDEANNWTTGEGVPLLQRTRLESQKAICSISRELVWKIHFEQAQIEERAMEIVALGRHLSTGKSLAACRHELSITARKCYTQSLMTCPSNLRWKVYLAGSRLEMAADQIKTAHLLLRQAKIEVPEKSKYHVYLECSRLEEFLGNIDSARKILSIARKEIKNEWKLYLEAVLVEARAGNMIGAIYLADKALSWDSGSGRLWALLVQLVHRCEWKNLLLKNDEPQEKDEITTPPEDRIDSAEITPPSNYKIPSKYTILCRALCVVPKSGEVWCEGARTLLNPLSMKYFDLAKAQKYLSFSIQFTPQYGDSFIEYIRLEMLTQVILPRVIGLLGVPINYFFSLLENFDHESDTSKYLSNPRELIETAFSGPSSLLLLKSDQSENLKLAKKGLLSIGHCKEALEKVSIKNLTRRCINADPNYGTAWFYCRTRPFDTPSAVIRSAFSILVHELISAQSIYVNAIVGYVVRVLTKIHDQTKSVNEQHPEASNEQNFDLESWLTDYHESSVAAGSKNEEKDNDKDKSNDRDKNKNKSKDNEEFEKKSSDEEEEEDDLTPPFVIEHPSKGIFSSQDFITGLIKLNRVMYTKDISPEERRKILFGVDQITP